MLIGDKQPDGSIDLPLIGPVEVDGDKVGDSWDGFVLGLMAGADPVPVAVEAEAVEVDGGSEVWLLQSHFLVEGTEDVVTRQTTLSEAGLGDTAWAVEDADTGFSAAWIPAAGAKLVPLVPRLSPQGELSYAEWGSAVAAESLGEMVVMPLAPGSEVAVLLLVVGIQGEMDVAAGSLKIPAAAGGWCGNDACDSGETKDNCPLDCGFAGPYCGDKKCDLGETAWSCAPDCASASFCGDGDCSGGESGQTCPVDCAQMTVCGNGKCESGESKDTCPKDCGAPPGSCAGKCGGEGSGGCYCDAACVQQGDCCADYAALCGSTGPVCGDGKCEGGESASSCPTDCAVPDDSCVGHCGDQAPSGCYCDAECVDNDDCCDDFAAVCGG
jgi:hypothetical protein